MLRGFAFELVYSEGKRRKRDYRKKPFNKNLPLLEEEGFPIYNL
jgi:hypothetical protein